MSASGSMKCSRTIVVKREGPRHRRNEPLRADVGYRGAEHPRTIERHGDIPHVVDRRKEAEHSRANSVLRRRRPGGGIAVCHSGFHRLRKRLVCNEKLERLFVAQSFGRSHHRVGQRAGSGYIIHGSILNRAMTAQ